MSITYIMTSTFLIVVLCMIYANVRKKLAGQDSAKIALVLIGTTIFYVLMDCVWISAYLSENYHQTLFTIINFLFYSVYITLPYVWFRFSQYYIDRDLLENKTFNLTTAIPWLFNAALIILTMLGTGTVWVIGDAANRYSRGPMFSIFSNLNLIYYFFPVIEILWKSLKGGTETDRRYYFSALSFSLVPALGVFIYTYLIPETDIYPFQPFCFFVGVMFAYFFLVDQLDRTNQKEQEKKLNEALAMAQSANRAKTTFLNNMSHDIRTPMNAIIGYTGLAAGHIDNKEQVQSYLSKISQSSNHLLSLINDVLDMSRIESGKMVLNEKVEDLSDILHTLRNIVQADVTAKQLHFYIDAVDVNDESIYCDKLRLNQVLLNILSNAIKYTAAGGTVAMRVTEKTVKPNGYASYEFSIKDNGMGMSRQFLETIFDPFTRVKSTTVSGIPGTGLGMAITKNIIDMMGGTINIESEQGKGTEVKVCFDFRLSDSPKTPVSIPELTGVRGLVVDDDANTCISVCGMLRGIGMRDEWCTSGKEAVIRAQEAYQIGDSFKVYIIDWLIPDMNGIETTRRIRRAIGDETPIIILTAYDWSDIEEEAKEAGVTAFVSKPLFPSDLHRVLNNCLGKEVQEQPAEEKPYSFEGKKVLLVEDNEINREIATEILTENGFAVTCAQDGDIAVERMKAAKEGDYDLILMDIQMPRMDGYEATRQIRALGTAASKLPILAMTANAFEEDRKKAIEAGMNEHIAKPIAIDKLKDTLAKFL